MGGRTLHLELRITAHLAPRMLNAMECKDTWSSRNENALMKIRVENQSVINIEGAGEDAQWCPDVYRALTIEGMFNLVQGYITRDDPIRVAINL